MNFGYFAYPLPHNEPVLSYAPGSAEREQLKNTIRELKKEKADIPMFIGGEEVRPGNKLELRPPHETEHLLGHFHEGSSMHVHQAIDAALKAKASWASMSWENRASLFLKAADLIATKYRYHMNATT